MMTPSGSGRKSRAFPKSASFAWMKRITSGKWVRPGRAGRARKFTMTWVLKLPTRAAQMSPSPAMPAAASWKSRSEEHTSELQSHHDLVCRLLLEKKTVIAIEYIAIIVFENHLGNMNV